MTTHAERIRKLREDRRVLAYKRAVLKQRLRRLRRECPHRGERAGAPMQLEE